VTLNQQPGAVGDGNPAIRLDGIDDYVNIPDSASLSPTGAVTVEAWVYLNAYGGSGGWSRVATKAATYCLFVDYLAGSPGQVEFDVWRKGSNVLVLLAAPADALQVGQWYHLAGTYDGQTARLYINGVERANATGAGTIPDTSNAVMIGGPANNGPIAAQVDEVAVYGTALSPARIQAHITAAGGGSGGVSSAASVAAPTPTWTPTSRNTSTPTPTATATSTVPSKSTPTRTPTPSRTRTPAPTPTP
jgi:hypothetical protein